MKYPQSLKKINNEKGMVLIIAVMLLAVLVVVGFTALNIMTTDTKISANYRENQRAFYNAEAGVETVMAYLRSTTITYPTSSTPTTITVTCPTGFSSSSGTCYFNTSVSINYVSSDNYKFQMTGTGYNNASKTIEVYITTKFQFNEGVDAAVAMYGSNPALAGGGAIDGHDHSLPPTNCSGASCHTPADGPAPDLPGLFSTEAVSKGSTAVDGGDPTATPPILAEVLDNSPAALAKDDQWTAFADDIVNSGVYNSTFSSDRLNPKITVLTSNLKLTGNDHHYGILVVSGADVEIETVGTFTFEGLIVLANGATLTTKGTANTYGSVITCNHSELTVTLNGTPTLMYSSAAIANLSKINAPHATRKTAWRDVF